MNHRPQLVLLDFETSTARRYVGQRIAETALIGSEFGVSCRNVEWGSKIGRQQIENFRTGRRTKQKAA